MAHLARQRTSCPTRLSRPTFASADAVIARAQSYLQRDRSTSPLDRHLATVGYAFLARFAADPLPRAAILLTGPLAANPTQLGRAAATVSIAAAAAALNAVSHDQAPAAGARAWPNDAAPVRIVAYTRLALRLRHNPTADTLAAAQAILAAETAANCRSRHTTNPPAINLRRTLSLVLDLLSTTAAAGPLPPIPYRSAVP